MDDFASTAAPTVPEPGTQLIIASILALKPFCSPPQRISAVVFTGQLWLPLFLESDSGRCLYIEAGPLACKRDVPDKHKG